MILSPTPQNISKAAQLLNAGGLVSFPTETVYGLGADATNSKAVAQIYTLKGRPANNPLIIHLATLDAVFKLLPPNTPTYILTRLKKLSKFWPGPLSTIVPASPSISALTTAGLNSMAVRIPNHEIALSVIKESGKPIAAPSANRSNYVSPTTAQHVYDEFGTGLNVVLDGGPCSVGLESTVVSIINSEVEIYRPGAITREELEDALSESVTNRVKDELVSPGMLPIHYSPKTKLIIKGALKESDYPARVGLIEFSKTRNYSNNCYCNIATLSDSASLEQVAQRLYAALRDMDTLNLDLIVIDSCATTGIGAAIMDRITRAQTKI